MYNLLIALAISIGLFLAVTAWLGPIPAVIPAVAVFGLAMFLLSRRVSQKVQPELDQLPALLEARNIAGAEAVLRKVRNDWGPWQMMLTGQIDLQLGMLQYVQRNWDAALPLLEAGSWRNWMGLTCIGSIQWRKGDKAKAYESFSKAADAAPLEGPLYLVWATLLERDGEREKALKVVDQGLKANAEVPYLVALKNAIANKRKVDTRTFPAQIWLQFFPEDASQDQIAQMQAAMTRGRKDGQTPQFQHPRPAGAPEPTLNRQQRRLAEKNSKS